MFEHRVADLLESVAARTPAPGGGASAALVTALAAALTAMSARFTDPEVAGGTAERAEAVRAAAPALADADVAAYGRYLAVLRSPRTTEPALRAARLREALDEAVDIPLTIAEAAAEVAALAARLARDGNPRLRGDAATGALLAAAAAAAAAFLVTENLANDPQDPRAGRARGAAAAARRAADGLAQW
ncbi:cyclodeaminase/cyclohydrolase family protein [Pseudonocardia hispaniensis]|uniref:Cyclodeaminase/cyclohydrolase family protein n=1 Tax=Pseudonocardia hispaniensis TaxID=904933 RepID=A0ABW1J672_9PSEU